MLIDRIATLVFILWFLMLLAIPTLGITLIWIPSEFLGKLLMTDFVIVVCAVPLIKKICDPRS